jgi:NAD(P)H-dependent FMN reductase
MITVIAGTNRKDSETAHFARYYFDLLSAKTDQKIKLLDLSEIEHDWFHAEMYSNDSQTESLARIQDEYMIPAEKFIFLTSEYNGSFPGAVKLFIDACSIRAYKETFDGKRAALVGVASGRAGNLRGMDHLSDVLNHMGTVIFPNKLPISSIFNLLSEEKEIIDKNTIEAIEKQVNAFLVF